MIHILKSCLVKVNEDKQSALAGYFDAKTHDDLKTQFYSLKSTPAARSIVINCVRMESETVYFAFFFVAFFCAAFFVSAFFAAFFIKASGI